MTTPVPAIDSRASAFAPHSHLSSSATKPSARHAGISMLEMMIATAITAALGLVALPQMDFLMMDTQISTNVNEFIAANAYARAEAIRRGQLVTICRSVHADTGTDACSKASSDGRAGDDWGSGWLVFVEGDTSAQGVGEINGDDEILLRKAAFTAPTQGSSSIRHITYNPLGQPINMAGANLKFHYKGKYQRTLCIARSGRLRVLRDVDNCSAG